MHGRRPGHVQRPRTSRDASVASSTRGVLHLLSKALWPSFTREVLHLLSKALYGLALCKALWPSSTRGVLHLLGKDLWPSSTKGCCISWARPYGRFFYNAQVREIETILVTSGVSAPVAGHTRQVFSKPCLKMPFPAVARRRQRMSYSAWNASSTCRTVMASLAVGYRQRTSAWSSLCTALDGKKVRHLLLASCLL